MAMEAAEDNGTAGKTVMRNLIMKNDNVLHHDNLYRPSPSYYWFNGHDAADIVAPNFPKLNNTNNNIISTSSFQSASAPAAPQTTSFNFSFLGEKGRMIPFTNGQWKELERQALIYKYMMASVPVPPHLLSPPYSLGGGMNVMMRPYSNGVGGDPEAGRCRRTDGKKWRCSREAAPDQKYCERHLHRGRPRSRKPVEPSLSTVDSKNIINKKIRIESDDHSRSFPSQMAGNVISSPFYQIQPLNKDQRCLDLMMKGEATPPMSSSSSAHQWQNYMMTMQEKPPPNSDSISNFFINPDLNSVQNHHQSREFIDAWSNKVSSCNNDYYDSNEYSPLSLSIKDETGSRVFRSGQTHEYDNTSWLAPVPWAHRGPLGEVFMPSSVTDPAASDPLSPAVDTTVSSPSGVLQKTLGASWSDRSGSNSPTTLASSKA